MASQRRSKKQKIPWEFVLLLVSVSMVVFAAFSVNPGILSDMSGNLVAASVNRNATTIGFLGPTATPGPPTIIRGYGEANPRFINVSGLDYYQGYIYIDTKNDSGDLVNALKDENYKAMVLNALWDALGSKILQNATFQDKTSRLNQTAVESVAKSYFLAQNQEVKHDSNLNVYYFRFPPVGDFSAAILNNTEIVVSGGNQNVTQTDTITPWQQQTSGTGGSSSTNSTEPKSLSLTVSTPAPDSVELDLQTTIATPTFVLSRTRVVEMSLLLTSTPIVLPTATSTPRPTYTPVPVSFSGGGNNTLTIDVNRLLITTVVPTQTPVPVATLSSLPTAGPRNRPIIIVLPAQPLPTIQLCVTINLHDACPTATP